MASLAALGIEVQELERWNCCGAVFSLSDDDLIHQVAPVRVLVRAMEAGSDTVTTLCAQCYNVLARANKLVREDEEKRKTLNLFMDEEPDYNGEVEVVHYLDLIREQVGWEKLREKVKVPLEGLKVAPFYGCTLLRPYDITVGNAQDGKTTALQEFITALGASPVDYPKAEECCGGYEIVVNPEASKQRSLQVLSSAQRRGADALILSCPLCDYNLGKIQSELKSLDASLQDLPVFYFTQLLAVALGLESETCRFDLNAETARTLLEKRSFVQAATA